MRSQIIPEMLFKKAGKVTIYQRISTLIIVSGAVFLTICLGSYYHTLEQEEEVYATTSEHFANEVDALIALYAQTNVANITDIVYWDEFVKYLNDRNDYWFDENVVSSLGTYHADYHGIYDVNGNFVRKASTSKIKAVDFIPKGVFEQIKQKKILRFFIQLPEGMVVVYGASVHTTKDVYKRVTPPSGYFFIARLLDAGYFRENERINHSKISYVDHAPPPSRDFVTVVKTMKSWDGKVIGKLMFQRPFEVSFQTAKSILFVLGAGAVLIVLIALWYVRLWVHRPLNLITGLFEREDGAGMESLRGLPQEFKYIGRLFNNIDKQKRELESAKAKAEESDRLKSSFLTNISHEIRTPMNAIVGFSDLLLKTDLPPQERHEFTAIINKSGANLVSIIDDLIEMSKIDTNQVSPNDDAVDVDAVLGELYKAVRISIPDHKALDFQIRKPVNRLYGKVITDQVKLTQILTNLVTNAIKYTESGFVLFGYEVNAALAEVEFTVQDSGIGIPKEQQDKIFDRFHRIENDLTIKAGGLGLGLAISKAYVRMLGGRITIDSSSQTGTTVNFTIPLRYGSSLPTAGAPSIVQNAASDHPITILVAEDDNINFLLIQKMLHQSAHRIIRAKDGLEAVRCCAAQPDIDLVLMDIKMPVMDGYAAFEEIRRTRPELPVIAQTAYASPEDEKKIMQCGFRGYISKPINKEKLFDLIDPICALKYASDR